MTDELAWLTEAGPSGAGEIREAALSFEQVRDRVGAAVQAKYGKAAEMAGAVPAYMWTVATYDDRVVVRCEKDGKDWELPYTIADGVVELGDPVEVVATFDHVTESQGALFEAVEGAQGREWDVLLISAGLSKNGRYYPADALEEAAPLFEGVAAYADHQSDQARRSGQDRSVKDKVGKFSNPTFGRHKIDGRVVEGIKARFKVIAPWLRETLVEAVNAGEPDFLGFSIDAGGTVSRKTHEGRTVSWVEKINKVHSVDVVSNPAAGGQVVRLVASAAHTEETMPDEQPQTVDPIAAVLERLTALEATISAAAAPPAEVAAPVAETVQEAITPSAAEEAGTDPIATRLMETERRLRVQDARARITEALSGVKLSDLAKERIRKSFLDVADRREFADAELTARITEDVAYEAALVQANPISVTGHQIAVGDSSHDQQRKALEGWFAGQAIDGVRPVNSIQESYCRWTGESPFDLDPFAFMGALSRSYDSARDHKRVTESLAVSDWAQVFADVFYLQMIREYQANMQFMDWRKVVSDIESLTDFRTRHFVRVGGYGDLSSVAERGTYPALTSPGDEEVTYAPAKYGGIEDISMEMILGDRLSIVKSMPGRMAYAASRTLYKAVMNLVTTDNPTLDYDSVALYHSNHGNTGTTALSVAGLNTTQIAMRDQTAFGQSQEILGARNKIRYLIVPNELESVAQRIVNPSDGYTFALSSTPDADTSIDPARWKGEGIEVIVYDVLTDNNNWFAVADPTRVPTVVVGFLNGRQEPELFTQDDPRVGSSFSADKVSFKVRHIWGLDVLEHRSLYLQVV